MEGSLTNRSHSCFKDGIAYYSLLDDQGLAANYVGYVCKEYIIFNTKFCCGLLIIQFMGQFYFVLFAIFS